MKFTHFGLFVGIMKSWVGKSAVCLRISQDIKYKEIVGLSLRYIIWGLTNKSELYSYKSYKPELSIPEIWSFEEKKDFYKKNLCYIFFYWQEYFIACETESSKEYLTDWKQHKNLLSFKNIFWKTVREQTAVIKRP